MPKKNNLIIPKKKKQFSKWGQLGQCGPQKERSVKGTKGPCWCNGHICIFVV